MTTYDLIERLDYATVADTGTGYLKRAALWREAAAALREQTAEIERLRAEIDDRIDRAKYLQGELALCLIRAEKAEAELAAARKDAERWQWWRKYGGGHDYQHTPDKLDRWADKEIEVSKRKGSSA